MAQKLDYTIPFNDLTQYVPQNLRNKVISGLLDNLFNRQMTHDESIPLYGYVGRSPSTEDDHTPRIPQSTVERDLNAIVPVLNFTLGSERITFTVQDLVNKARTIGISQAGQNWLYSQANNYLPPIDIDKFSNFFNYFWVAKALPGASATVWNPELLPEYYVIAKPELGDLQKLNVVAATTTAIVRTGTGFNDQEFTLTFSNPLTFTLKANNPLGAYHTFGIGASSSVGAPASQYDQYTFSLSAASLEQSYEDSFSFDVQGPGGTVTLMTFKIVRDPIYDSDGNWIGNESFVAGDGFTIDTTFLSRTYNIVFFGSAGVKGKIKSVSALSTYQTIDGVLLEEGQRVLVKNNSSIENGIYIVQPQSWTRAADYEGSYIVPGAKVWVAGGTVNGGKLFTSGLGNSWTGAVGVSNTNDWQEGNYWVHSTELSGLGLSRAEVVQAVRPIIEYSSTLQLNSFILNGAPAASGVQFKQQKTEFNQLPMFDLFRYDGTHSGLVSSVFFYVQDLTAELDLDLQKRVKISSDSSADFVFDHGLVDQDGDLLFYKENAELKTIWHPGYDEPTVVDHAFIGAEKGFVSEVIPTTIAVPQSWVLTATSSTTFTIVGSSSGTIGTATVDVQFVDSQFSLLISSGAIPFVVGEQFTFSISAGPTVSTITFVGGSKGDLTSIVPAEFTQQQVWTISATSSTTFSVQGSKSKNVPAPQNTITVGVPYVGLDFSCLITQGSISYDVGDAFILRIGNREFPRYVTRSADGSISDLYGGEAADTTGVGAYEVHRMFSYNPYNESKDEILEGTLYSHFRGILQNQIQGLDSKYAFGGSIKGWSEQQSLLAALLMQRDSTPISVIDLAERQYEVGLNAIADLYTQNIVQYFATNGVLLQNESSKLNALLDELLSKRALDTDVRTVLYDTTAAVLGFPATLPQLGILPRVQPMISVDTLLGQVLMTHHDGHNSALYSDTLDFRRAVLNNSADLEVLRSDGSTGAAVGSFTTTPPAIPYRGQLWIKPSGAESLMYAFDVDSDSDSAPVSVTVGTTWYNRSSNVLSIWDGVQWVQQSSHDSQWVLVDLAALLNQLILILEQRLYDGINPNASVLDFSALMSEPEFKEQLKRELFSYSVLNGLDPLGSDYIAADAFTWNYSAGSTANFAPLSTSSVPARWNNVLKAHQMTVPGVIPTDRPNLEPWKLLGFTTFESWWGTLSPSVQASYTPYVDLSPTGPGLFGLTDGGYVRVIQTALSNTMLSGLQIIDGVLLATGDIVALQNEAAPANNGFWQVSSGAWTRVSPAVNQGTYFTVLEGAVNQGTIWVSSTTVLTPSAGTPVLLKQARIWSDALWAAVQAARPALRLSVDTTRDALLPPYVSPTVLQAVNALTTVIPPSITASYEFGENGPVESVWLSSLQFGYSLARALFRYDPLKFLKYCWGYNWVQVQGLLYDGYDLNIPGHKRFRLHGEAVRQITRDSSALTIAAATGSSAVDVTITYDAYEISGSARFQNFTVRSGSTVLGYLREGVLQTISSGGVMLNNVLIQDAGKPFHIGDSFRITAAADGSNLLITFTPATTYKFLGFGQIFTNALRSASVDTTQSYAVDAYREWDVHVGYRAGGLVATDDLIVRTDSSTLSPSSYSLLFKKNEYAKDLWVQGLRITVRTFGEAALVNGVQVPKTDGSDWEFLIEGYNPRYSNITYYVLNTSGSFETFNVLDQSVTSTVWKNFSSHAGTTSTYLPLRITGIQNVVNFLFGYSRYLENDGWRFNQDPALGVDAETGRSRTWQLEVEKFINVCYRGLEAGQGHIVNPFMDQLWVQQDTGLLAEFADTSLFDITGHAGVFDLAGVKMKTADLFVTRGNLISQFGAAAPMYSAHAQIDEYEHLFVFNRYIEDSTSAGLLYHPFSGSRVVTYKFNGRRQASDTFRPEFGGHYLVGHEVRQNIQASTDNITKFYDTNHAFENDLTTRHALSVLGFNTKTYFDDLDISEKSQFNFWRGLIQSKGTNLSIQAYLNNNRFEDAKIDEYWAYKVAEYGDARQNTYPELKLSVDDSIQQFTQLQFDAAVGDELPNFTQISRLDESRWFSIDDLDQDAYFVAEVLGTFNRSATVGQLLELPFVADKLVGSGFSQVNATTIQATGTTVAVTGYGPATPRYNPVKLLNYVSNELVEEIPLWHPAIGQHTPTALESINIISTQNPAKYNYSTQVANNNSYDPLRPWGSNEVGRVWFDTRNLQYIPYYDQIVFSDRAERLSRWGALADFASIDVYEWVQSAVPPTEYNALAALQAGDADLDPATKAAGEVALQETYSRDRQWSIRPIAWSYSTVPVEAAHPQFLYSADVSAGTLYVQNGVISLDRGTFAELSAVAGSRVGVWDVSATTPVPRSEAIITDTFTKLLVPTASFSTADFEINVSVESHTAIVGPIAFTQEPSPPIQRSDTTGALIDSWDTMIQLRVWEVDGDVQEVVTLSTVTGDTSAMPNVTLLPGQSTSFSVSQFGLLITVKAIIGGMYPADAIRDAVVAELAGNITMQDAVQYSSIVEFPTPVANGFINDSDDIEYNSAYEWRIWNVPTQAELDADGQQPNASWKPYLGEFTSVPGITLTQIQDAVAYSKAPLTLNNDAVIERYETTWGEWSVLKNTVLTATQTGTGSLTISNTTTIDETLTSVYVNGITQLSAAYSVQGSDVVLSSVPAGSTATVIIRHYEPSTKELAFDPTVSDDLTFQRQFKQDYEYVSLPVRDSEGSISSTLYYFWVKNKSTPAKNKKYSVQSISQDLRDGPANFLTFQHLIGSGSTSDPYRYDAITISGLSYIIAKDDTFKLRFTRNFTLRDDPQNLDLKDTHTEWSLIRPGQRTRVPESLWQKLVDSAAGEDAAGNPVPALRRSLYDERNGTRTQFGFSSEQTLAPKDLLISSILYTIVNTKLINKSVPANADGSYPADFIEFLDFTESDTWFATPAATRKTMTDIWTSAKPTQINEIFFAALNDILASNYELTDIFKTSRLAAYSIKVIAQSPTTASYE